MKKQKSADLGVILLSEYHASFIRLRRVLLLCSDIRLTPSGIRFASFRANRIPLKPQGFNITIAAAIISLFAKAKNITKKAEKERASRNFVTALLSLLFLLQVSHLFYKCIGLRPYPYLISPIRTSCISPSIFYTLKSVVEGFEVVDNIANGGELTDIVVIDLNTEFVLAKHNEVSKLNRVDAEVA